MQSHPRIQQITINLRANSLILELDRSLDRIGPATVTVDIGALGRLLGVELDDLYFGIADAVPGSEGLERSVTTTVSMQGGKRIVLPRRGEGWEISFPSGNQCWKRTTATGSDTICSVIA